MKSHPIWAMHGFLGHHSDFDLFQHQGWNIQAVDLVGHGAFQSDATQFSTAAQVTYWSQHLPSNAVVMGYSMGARLALQIAVQNPNAYKGLILIGGTPGIENETEIQQRQLWDQRQAERILELGMCAFLDEWQQMPIIQSQENIALELRQKMRYYREQQNPIQMAYSMKYFGTGRMPHCWNQLNNLKIPVLLVVGAFDQKYLEIAQKMQRYLPSSTLLIIPNAGHCAHLEQPVPFMQEVHTWLASI